MLLLLLSLLPLLLIGVLILQRISSISRIELLFPAGSILGLAVFTFFLNSVAFVIKAGPGIFIAYFLTVLFGFVLLKFIQSKNKVDFPRGKQLFFWAVSLLLWGGLFYWKASYALIGSDTNLYWAIAYSFVKGNFPFLTPWQPGIILSYHVGISELLGAFYFFSGLNFQFLHLFFSAFFIFCVAQIIIWLMNRWNNSTDFLLSNIASAVVFFSFGFIYIVWPFFPINLPSLSNFNQLVIWFRNLPTVNQALEVYGAPVNLDGLIYFIFHSFGIALFFLIIAMILNIKKEKKFLAYIFLFICLVSLALTNEGIFTALFPAAIIGLILFELKEKTLRINIKKIFFLVIATILTVSISGGVISSSINMPKVIEKSILLFPKKEDIKEDFKEYHLGQEKSKVLSLKTEWLPFRWFHIGIELLLVFSLIAVLLMKNDLSKILFTAGFTSLLSYNFVVPKFLIANGNRLLTFSFFCFALILSFFLIFIFKKIKKSLLKKILFLTAVGWIFIPTILPPLALLSKTRFGENKLLPKYEESSKGMLWLKKNAGLNEKVMVLDKNAPHPSGQIRALVEAGVFAPVFSSNFRAFTIEASPEYTDIAYYLSPAALDKLKISLLFLDNDFLKTLPEERKIQLKNPQYFEKISNFGDEMIYEIKKEYLEKGGELTGTLGELAEIVSSGKIFIDNEESFDPSFLRRPLIFSLKDRDIYYLPQSGVYLNVEANINSHSPLASGDYDYLLLGKNSDPRNVCICHPRLIWSGLRGEVLLWKADR